MKGDDPKDTGAANNKTREEWERLLLGPRDCTGDLPESIKELVRQLEERMGLKSRERS